MRSSIVLAFVPLIVSCATDPGLDDEPGDGKADGSGSSIRVIQSGMFRDDVSSPIAYTPKLLHYGFVSSRGESWQDIKDASIKYLNHQNAAVVVEVPAQHASDLLVFSIYSESHWHSKWSNADMFIDLEKHRHGSLATFPVTNFAPYPFSDSCYSVDIAGTRYQGKVTHLLYGFTTASAAEYAAHNDVAWLDASDNAANDGRIPVTDQHDGGYKGTYVMLHEYVWVPRGESLVFKLEIDKYGNDGFDGYCGGNQYFQGHALTQAYFAAVP